jgi:hypothetical protein
MLVEKLRGKGTSQQQLFLGVAAPFRVRSGFRRAKPAATVSRRENNFPTQHNVRKFALCERSSPPFPLPTLRRRGERG